MAQFNGFTCDVCGNVVDSDTRTKVTIRYRGPIQSGEYSEDRCPLCLDKEVAVPQGVTLKPLRKRPNSKENAQKPATVG